MPREERRYYCDVCGEFYGEIKNAEECEKSHLLPISVSAPKYSKGDSKKLYPESVLVHFNSDKKPDTSARYYREQRR